MRALVVLLLASLGTTGCLSDTVTSRYVTLAEARADGLFGRGWLPDILPTSARNIRTSNNLDLNTSTGEFFFATADARQFFGRLSAGRATDAPFVGWSDTVDDYAEDGFSAWSYRDEDTTWAFFCHASKGRCDYFLWMPEQAANNSFKPKPLRGSA